MKGLLVLTTLALSFNLFAEEEAGKPVSLKEAINLTLKNNLEIKTETFKKNIALTDLDLIKGETSTKISLLAGVGPIKGKKGNYLGYTDTNKWGPEWITSIDAKIPLYLWGREENLKKAATLNGKINELDVTKKQLEVIYKLKEAYYGQQYALSLYDFVKETEKDLTSAMKALQEKNAKKEDALKIEVFLHIVEEKRIEIEKSIKLAALGLKFYTGENNIANERTWIELDERELKELSYYKDLLQKNYPDLQKVKMGIEAKSNLLENEKKSYYPVIAALLKYDLAYTNQRTKQHNPFIYDQYNHSDVGAGIGFTWDFDFGVKKSKNDKLVLEIAELQSKEHFAKEGLSTLVEKSYMEVEATKKRAEALEKAYKTSKKWMSNIGTSIGLGLAPAKDIIDAYTTRAAVYKDYYEAIYNHQLAWAALSQAVGVEVDPLLTESK